MKSILIAAAFLTLAPAMVAQTSMALSIPAAAVNLTPNQVVYENCPATQKITTTIDVKNTSAATHSYGVTRYDIKLSSAGVGDSAMSYFCFAGQCYDNTTFISQAPPLVLGPGQNAASSGQYFALDADYW